MHPPIKLNPDFAYNLDGEGSHLFLVQCRVHDDDDDSVYLIRAHNQGEAQGTAMQLLREEADLTEEEVELMTFAFGDWYIEIAILVVGTFE